jgi:murein DD-endopeptidase MepM/ murein hydrolase activator NlpD
LLIRRRGPLLLGLLAAALIALGLSVVPSASADACTVKVTVAGGQTYTFYVNAPAGTPVSSLNLPVQGVVTSETESCTPTSSSSSTTISTTPHPLPSRSSSSSSSSSTTTSSSSSSPSKSGSGSSSTTTSGSHPSPKPNRPGQRQKSSSHSSPSSATTTPAIRHHRVKKPAASLPTGKGVPAASNPSFSLSLPGPSPIGVPNFFIDSFRIPPFLIPIYQAAGIEYQVPWQVLAAINEIETDYGRNLSVSSAGAVGWMQFLPSTFKRYAVDANGDGFADPYNPVDAIFTAAHYLHAAGASTNLAQAIFAYNHAGWYVQSVLLRAKLIGGIPGQLIGALTGLVSGHFPVAAPAKYADASVLTTAKHRVKTANAAQVIDSTASQGTSIFAKKGSPVIAVNDGRIVRVGQNATLGRYVQLQDSTGNIYTYSQLGAVSTSYPVPKAVRITAKDIALELSATAGKPPKTAASAGQQRAGVPPTLSAHRAGIHKLAKVSHPAAPITLPVKPATPSGGSVAAPMAKERLFANPSRSGSYSAGGDLQLKNSSQQISSFQNYFSDALHLARNQYTLKALRKGAIVVAGTILGRIGAPSQHVASHLYFTIRPAGKKAPMIDPKPILDGWKLLEATAVYRAAGVDPFFGPGAKNPSVGQVLLMSKEQLTQRVLADPHVQIYNCGRRDIVAGLIDRRVLATIEFLSASGLDPYVSGLECGHSLSGSTGTDAAGATGSSVDISKINNIPIQDHQGPGSIADITIRRLLTLQGSMIPNQIISDMSYKGQSNTLALPDHKNRIQITFTPEFGTNKKLSAQVKALLRPGQWVQLINHISQIPEPIVPIAPSKYAIKLGHH